MADIANKKAVSETRAATEPAYPRILSSKKEKPEVQEVQERKTIEEGSNEDASSEESDEDQPRKGVTGLIETANPNAIVGRQTKKASELVVNGAEGGGGGAAAQLSRREREEVEKAAAKARYDKLHAEGKTDEARADLARLAIVRKEREEAARRRLLEKEAKEEVSRAASDARKEAQTNTLEGRKSKASSKKGGK